MYLSQQTLPSRVMSNLLLGPLKNIRLSYREVPNSGVFSRRRSEVSHSPVAHERTINSTTCPSVYPSDELCGQKAVDFCVCVLRRHNSHPSSGILRLAQLLFWLIVKSSTSFSLSHSKGLVSLVCGMRGGAAVLLMRSLKHTSGAT